MVSRIVVLPRVEFSQAAVQVLQSSDQKPPAVQSHLRVIQVRVQDKNRVQLLTVSQSCHQCWVVVQPEALSEPMNTYVSHFWRSVNTYKENVQYRVTEGLKIKLETY